MGLVGTIAIALKPVKFTYAGMDEIDHMSLIGSLPESAAK